MVLRLCRFGRIRRKAFLFTALTLFTILMLFASVSLYAGLKQEQSIIFYSSNLVSTNFLEINQEELVQDQDILKLFDLYFYHNDETYFLIENYWKGKHENISQRMNTYAKLLQIFSNYSLFNLSFDCQNINASWDNIILSGENLNYSWNYLTETLSLSGNFSVLNLTFNTSATTISSNCRGTDILVNVRAGTMYAAGITLGSACVITVKSRGKTLPINFDGANFSLDYSNLDFSIQNNFSVTVPHASDMRFLGKKYFGNMAGTINPGWVEPIYPPLTAEVKHYGNITILGKNYSLILIDFNNNSVYDSLYVDMNDNKNFTDAEDLSLIQNSSHIFLNNRIFLINIEASGSEVKFEDVFGVYIKKGENVFIQSW